MQRLSRAAGESLAQSRAVPFTAVIIVLGTSVHLAKGRIVLAKKKKKLKKIMPKQKCKKSPGSSKCLIPVAE